MNEQTKVIEAINRYETAGKDIETKRQALSTACQAENTAEQELIRVLKAVYGGRAAKGVVIHGVRYWVEFGLGGKSDELHVDQADFEVLG